MINVDGLNPYVIDTNALIKYPNLINRYQVVVTSHVLRELEKLELTKRDNRELQSQISKAKKVLDDNEDTIFIDIKDYEWKANDDYDKQYVDNMILQCCIDNKYGLITGDRLLRMKAKIYNVPIIKPEVDTLSHEDYTGVKDLFLDPTKMEDQLILASIYEGKLEEEMLVNQYLAVWDLSKPNLRDGEVYGYEPIDQFRFDGERLVKLKFKDVDNHFLGKVKPANVKQKLAFDMLQNKNTTVKALFGGFGVGKDFLMVTHAINMLFNPKSGIDKIVWVRNNVEVKDTNPIGFLPDSMDSKLMPFAMPLADHLGGLDGLQSFLRNGKIEIQHLGFIRGRDIKNSIIYVTECENNTKEHIQLLIGRVGEGSQLWLNGDYKQTDNKKFEENSGLNSLKKLKGNSLYGQVTLDKVERSETARLADLLD